MGRLNLDFQRERERQTDRQTDRGVYMWGWGRKGKEKGV